MKPTLNNSIKKISILEIEFDNWVIDTFFLPVFIFAFVLPVTFTELEADFTNLIFFLWILEKILVWSSCYIFWRSVQIELEKRELRKVNLIQICLIGFIGGLITTGFGAILIYAFKLPSNVGTGARFLTTSLISIAIIICTSILGRKRREYALRRKSFRKTSIQSKFLELRKDKNFSKEINNYENVLKNDLIEKMYFDNVDSAFKNMEMVREYSHGLNDRIMKDVRKNKIAEFKHALTQEFKFVIYSFQRQALRPSIFAFVIALIFGVPLIRNSYQPITYILTILYFYTTYCCHYIERKLLFRKNISFILPIVFNLISIFLIIAIDCIAFLFYPDLFTHTVISLRLLFLFMTYIFFCFAGHFAQGSSMLEEYLLLSDLVSENQSKYVKFVKKQLEDNLLLEWSSFLHNEVQARLLSIALTKKNQKSSRELKDISQLIQNKSFISESSKHARSTSISKNLIYLTKLWKNVISIEYKLDQKLSEVNSSKVLFIEILEVINELIANAVRHGEASEIKFNIEARSNNRYSITAINNGLAYKPIKKGLGSILLDEVAPSNWSIKNSSNLVKVKLVLIDG